MIELISSVFALYGERWDWFLGLLREHFLLSGQAILLSGAIGLLLGVWISQHPRLAPAVMGVCNVLYTIPAISLLGILIPFTGIGNRTAVTALTIYGIMPMVRTPTWASPPWTGTSWRPPGAWAAPSFRPCCESSCPWRRG